MSQTKTNGPVLAADGTPLKKSLARALRVEKTRALMLIAPLLIFVLISFIIPIVSMLFRSVDNRIVDDTIPYTVAELAKWQPEGEALPPEALFEALYYDMFLAAEAKQHTRLGSRFNYEESGFSSLFRKSGRALDDLGKDYLKQLKALDRRWGDSEVWYELMSGGEGAQRDTGFAKAVVGRIARLESTSLTAANGFAPSAEIVALLPKTAEAYTTFANYTWLVDEAGRRPGQAAYSAQELAGDKPWESVFPALIQDLQTADIGSYSGPQADMLRALSETKSAFVPPVFQATFADIDKDWADAETWQIMKAHSVKYTNGYFLNAVDMKRTPDGAQVQDEDKRVLLKLFGRTMWMSLVITSLCVLLGYPVAWILANLPARSANLLMILVLLPFWTSLLVRTSAWKVMLQQQGVINDVLVWLGFIADDSRLIIINNATGTIIAMTHILLPFMILPMYSVMQTIQPSYLRAAKSLGATNWTAFWRVYFPQSIPGIGAGSILVFILAIGYYITPEIVGGNKGVFISNRIAYHISTSLNWGLAAALGSILLGAVLILYWAYDKIVGIDNVKLG
ncbi:ABC transporter permease [uncultured Lentibacter sp.]|uniref:ABC transporter permease n=1 Tax=uncultured Lentibacter sp. TaxID=1659309 RepID=UPI0026232C6A|nr:ABC transporter permease [uncultured Lentibacter sp.]MCW1956195.1 ABC transporter permease [Roseobacter sp.]